MQFQKDSEPVYGLDFGGLVNFAQRVPFFQFIELLMMIARVPYCKAVGRSENLRVQVKMA